MQLFCRASAANIIKGFQRARFFVCRSFFFCFCSFSFLFSQRKEGKVRTPGPTHGLCVRAINYSVNVGIMSDVLATSGTKVFALCLVRYTRTCRDPINYSRRVFLCFLSRRVTENHISKHVRAQKADKAASCAFIKFHAELIKPLIP